MPAEGTLCPKGGIGRASSLRVLQGSQSDMHRDAMHAGEAGMQVRCVFGLPTPPPSQALQRQLEEGARARAEMEAASQADKQEREARSKGMQEDSKALENSWKAKVRG